MNSLARYISHIWHQTLGLSGDDSWDHCVRPFRIALR